MKKRALFSVSDKTGIVDFAKRLVALNFEIVSTGGTYSALQQADIPVTNISEITGFPECLDGRVKTLHPVVHAGILAIRDNPDHMAQLKLLDIVPIDVVAINLYPFKQTILRQDVLLEEAIENIDIGGPTMIRAAAKNWQDIAVVVDPSDYDDIASELEKGILSKDKKFALMAKVFSHTAHYDALIANYMAEKIGEKYPEFLTLTYEKQQDLRYGENPHQDAVFYREVGNLEGTLPKAKQLHGKELSFNNINDAAGAIALVKEFSNPCAVAVKHANPCGVGIGDTISQAYNRAYEADPVSIFGGIVALNRACDQQTAQELHKIFLEIVIAPSFTQEAIEILSQKKNIRLLELSDIEVPVCQSAKDFKKVAGGLLLQSVDTQLFGEKTNLVTKNDVTDAQKIDLELAWKVCKHVKSNGIVLAKDGRTVGVGPGQTNRITALNLAINYAGENAKGSVMASDAFFPFSDCVQAANQAGITAIMQPGGSVKDQESIDACDNFGIGMLFTGMRHFKH